MDKSYLRGYGQALSAHLFAAYEAGMIDEYCHEHGGWNRSKEWEDRVHRQFREWFLDRFGCSPEQPIEVCREDCDE